MVAPIFHQLREQMDQYSTGFPATESGVELKILEKLFTEEDAEIYLDLSMLLEGPADFAARTGRSPEESVEKLEDMAIRGLLFRHVKDGISGTLWFPLLSAHTSSSSGAWIKRWPN